ncbi:MAG: iron ABC transporter permease [Candidatus Wallbacteria bacterium HGW-Wallbacteria-1]|jgi:iron complex transport system permease protein|uniref:Iron ABC transporter permease n=1 Tax=Candidatus Wallbacteria bacterium HGW-Wallbacteria-1 TaxID=2013854 RepID=A0A2N1PLB3_9BACT|nr:MAG: iron ABC transporter permease [Candidatus Wallbacteria bacterium HGW-Wallbacteria-1]
MKRSTLLFGLTFAALALFSLCTGNYPIPYERVMAILLGTHDGPSEAEVVVRDIRLPRVIMASVVGGSLAIAGGAAQALFRNPLVSPMILGISSGAALGASVAIVWMNGSVVLLQLMAFGGGLIAVLLSIWLSSGGFSGSNSGRSVITLILSGVAVGAFCQAATGLVKYAAESDTQLPAITFWMMGGFDGIRWKEVFTGVPVMMASSMLLWAMAFRLDVISLGEWEARSLGTDPGLIRILIVVLISMSVGAGVALCGVIGWVGLVIPHGVRILFGPGHRRLIPLAGLAGAIFTLASDDLARTVTAGEIPVGIITSFVGAPVFALILARRGTGSWK